MAEWVWPTIIGLSVQAIIASFVVGQVKSVTESCRDAIMKLDEDKLDAAVFTEAVRRIDGETIDIRRRVDRIEMRH